MSGSRLALGMVKSDRERGERDAEGDEDEDVEKERKGEEEKMGKKREVMEWNEMD